MIPPEVAQILHKRLFSSNSSNQFLSPRPNTKSPEDHFRDSDVNIFRIFVKVQNRTRKSENLTCSFTLETRGPTAIQAFLFGGFAHGDVSIINKAKQYSGQREYH